jgi:hypothetical protein
MTLPCSPSEACLHTHEIQPPSFIPVCDGSAGYRAMGGTASSKHRKQKASYPGFEHMTALDDE